MGNNTCAFRYSKFEYVNKLKLEYVNGHFSVENNTRGSTYSTVEYAKKKKNTDDDDDGYFKPLYGYIWTI